jgi:hypothetical protein
LICSSCMKQVEAFDKFFERIHTAQQHSQQKDEIRYIILLKSDKPDEEIQFKEIEQTEQQITLIDIPESYTAEEPFLQEPQEHPVEQVATTSSLSVEVNKEFIEILPTECESTVCSKTQINLEGFPNELIKDGKLIVKGKELSKLIARFYQLECTLCSVSKKFRKLTVMLNHFKNQHSMKGFVSCCGIKIVKLRQIAMHMCRHIQPEAFTCSICNKLLTCPKILQYHVQNHLPEHERSLACPEPGCSRRFSYQSALTTHSITHLAEEDRTTYDCCGRKFMTAGRLTAHINTVHSKVATKKEFSCEKCSKRFLCKSNLAYHLTTHKDFEYQVQCKLCDKWLKNKICLRKHMTIHSEIRHSCDICEYSAVNRQCLINHKKIQHSDIKPYHCSICLKSFKLKNTLTNHMNAQHNGIRKYSCEFCQRTFVSSGNCKFFKVSTNFPCLTLFPFTDYSHRKRMHANELKIKLQEKEINDNKKRMEIQNSKLEGK